MSARSRTSRRTKHRTPSPPPLPSSDADSESESDSDRGAVPAPVVRTPTREPGRTISTPKPRTAPAPPPTHTPLSTADQMEEDNLGPAPPPSDSNWQCEHCTFVNEPGVRVCAVCCRTPTTAPRVLPTNTAIAAPVEPTITIAPITSEPSSGLERLKLKSPSPVRIVPQKINSTQSQSQYFIRFYALLNKILLLNKLLFQMRKALRLNRQRLVCRWAVVHLLRGRRCRNP